MFGCLCRFDIFFEVNIFNCHNANLTFFPNTIVNDTDWLLLSGNSLGEINNNVNYLSEIETIDISSSEVQSIENDIIASMVKAKLFLDIRNNRLTSLPRAIVGVKNTTELWISNNPCECNCDMMWMRVWLIKATNVEDRENVTCATGQMKGRCKNVPVLKPKKKKNPSAVNLDEFRKIVAFRK